MPEISLSCSAPRHKAAIYKTATASTPKELEQNLRSPKTRVLPLLSPAKSFRVCCWLFFLFKKKTNKKLQTRALGTVANLRY